MITLLDKAKRAVRKLYADRASPQQTTEQLTALLQEIQLMLELLE